MSPHRDTDSEIGTRSGVSDVGQAHRSLHTVVADRIRDAIVSGTLYPGERLVEDRLAKELEVSRHPVREALRTLQLEGFVDISPRRGATVSRVTTEEGSELFEVLSALDGLSARLAATKRNDGAIDEIDRVLAQANAILQEGSGKLSGDDLAALARLNREFHHCIASAGANRQLIESITSLRDRIQWIQAAVNRRRPELSWAEHHQIRNAVAGQDADAAETLARSHIDAARVEYLAQRPQANAATLGSVRKTPTS